MKKLFGVFLLFLLATLGQARNQPRQWRTGLIIHVYLLSGERTVQKTYGSSGTYGKIDDDGNIDLHGTSSSTTVPVTTYDPFYSVSVEDDETGTKYEVFLEPKYFSKRPALEGAIREHTEACFPTFYPKGISYTSCSKPVHVQFDLEEVLYRNKTHRGFWIIFPKENAKKELKVWCNDFWTRSEREESSKRRARSPEVQHAKSCTDLATEEDQAWDSKNWEQVVSLAREYISKCRDQMYRNEEIDQLWYIGAGLNALGKSEDALPVLRRCASLKPDAPDCFFEMGVSFEALAHSNGTTAPEVLPPDFFEKRRAATQDAIESYHHVLEIGGYDKHTAKMVELAKQRLAVLEATR